jgi:hypothetical protein
MYSGYKQTLRFYGFGRTAIATASTNTIKHSNVGLLNRFISNTGPQHMSYVQNKFANLFLDVKERK